MVLVQVFVVVSLGVLNTNSIHNKISILTNSIPSSKVDMETISKMMYLLSQKKDPFAAAFLSLYIPGAGQIYAGDYTEGSLLVLGDIISKVFMAGVVNKINDKYEITAERSITWEELDDWDKGMLVGAVVFNLGIHTYAALRAYYSVEEKNSAINSRIKSLWLEISTNRGMVGVELDF